MKFRTLLGSVIGLEISLLGTTAHASYVVEAEAMGTERSAIAAGAEFDFVVRDFGMEPKDAIRITLKNLASASNLRGNLLLWSFQEAPGPAAVDEAEGAAASVELVEIAAPLRPGSAEDYSHYDVTTDIAWEGSASAEAGPAGGEQYPLVTGTGELLPASGQATPPIDSNEIFWILRPTEFTSFSQLTAARFGFDHSQ